MKWITARDLEAWANVEAARSDFPALIGDLIRASAATITDFRFPRGDKAQVRGFDGYLEAEGSPPYVPGGESIWELGVGKGDAAKANADFAKRVAQIPAADRARKTFVFASPQTWDDQK